MLGLKHFRLLLAAAPLFLLHSLAMAVKALLHCRRTFWDSVGGATMTPIRF
jgi:hypothetical protein